MLRAVATVEQLIERGVAAGWAVGTAAHHHAVPADELAMRVLSKLVDVQRARRAVSSMKAVDDAELDPIPRQKAKR